MSLFEQIAKTANPNPIEGLEIALKKSMDNFDTLHAELMEAVNLLNIARAYVACYGGDSDIKLLDKIDTFLTKHS